MLSRVTSTLQILLLLRTLRAAERQADFSEALMIGCALLVIAGVERKLYRTYVPYSTSTLLIWPVPLRACFFSRTSFLN